MPWLTIIMALLSFFATKASGGSNTKALVAAGLAGAGTYYTTHNTDWGKANLGKFDGVTPVGTGADVVATNGQPVTDLAGNTVKQVVDGTFDTLKSWGGTGTAAVIGTAALAGGAFGSAQKWLPWLVGGGVLLLMSR